MLKRFFAHLHETKMEEEAVIHLIEKSQLEIDFFIMCALSGLLGTIGILLNDTVILISATVLAPLLNPILAFAAGLSLMNARLIIYAAKNFFGSVIFTVLVNAGFVKILLLVGYNFEISDFAARFSQFHKLLYLAAFISGFSAVYSWLKATDLSRLVGVAIAVSLIPFVSFFGILFGMGEFSKMYDSYMTFCFNLFFIVFGATIAFLILGLVHFRKAIAKELE